MCNLETTSFTREKAADAFVVGRSKLAKRMGNKLKYLGPQALRVIDALEDADGQTRAELVESTGMGKSAVATACRRLKEHGIIDEYRDRATEPYTVYLSPEAWEIVEDITPQMVTFQIGKERRDRRLEAIVKHITGRLDPKYHVAPVERRRLQERALRALDERVILTGILHPNFSDDDIMSWVYIPDSQASDDMVKDAKRNRMLADVRTEAMMERPRKLREAAEQMADVAPRERYRMAMLAGFAKNEARVIANRAVGSW